ncbi:limonene-1,2-epoxide hydrolase family protein [Nocardia brasiliensis]|uniref:limonene-1,2-epoxide hydrolase family protein n=1 Tax=Nocardia brasiliensis TaxID=37326 RepID=UPI002453D632|nr:limonene-1,2-epoxide hydrolase family protein [Nocardia brasiliensis]
MTQDLDLQQDAITTVREFFSALELGAVAEALELLHPEVVWKNSTLPAVGGGLTRKILRGLERDAFGFEVQMHHIAADGDFVLTDRTDVLRVGPVRVAFWVMGTLEVRDGRIILWDDHFSWHNLLRGAVAGVARAALSR